MMLPNDIQNDIWQTVYPPHFHTVLRVLCNDFRTRFGCKVIMGIIARLIFRKHLRIFQLADIVIICTCSCQSSICADFIRRRLCQICHNQAMMIRSRCFNHQPTKQLIIRICQLQQAQGRVRLKGCLPEGQTAHRNHNGNQSHHRRKQAL